jgi:hypothetical protein
MEEETVDCFEAPFRFQPEGKKKNHRREHTATEAAINTVTYGGIRDD